MAVVDAVVSGDGNLNHLNVVWPSVLRIAEWMGGGPWSIKNGLLHGSFFEGGLVAHRLVRSRAALLERGQLVADPAVVIKMLPVLCTDWVTRAVRTPEAVAVRAGDLGQFPPSHASLLRAKRRKLSSQHSRALAEPPRCVKCALTQPAPWKNRMRWMMAHTLVVAAGATGHSILTMEAAAVAAMERRGDGASRIKEFKAAVRRATAGKIIRIPCKKRGAQTDGLWCPLGGDVERCAAERGVVAPPNATPGDMWAPPTPAPAP